jgi:hypothetical protein
MAGELGKVVVVVGADTGDFSKAIEEIKKALGETEKKTQDAGKSFEDTGKKLSIAGGAITAAITGMVYATVKAGEEINNLSTRYGLATEVLSGYKLAAAQNETSLQGLAVGFKFLAKNIDEAKTGNKDSIKAFKELGVSLKDAHGKAKPMNDVLLDIADRFSGMENNEQKAIVATQLFGKSGNELIPFLNQGREGLKAAADQAARMGIVFTAEGAAAADALGDSFTALSLSAQGLGKSLVQGIVPNLTKIADAMTEGVSSATTFLNKNQELATVLTSLAGGVGLAATAMGAGLIAIAKIGPAFTAMATAAKTSVAALGLAAAGIGLVAGAAFAAYKIYMDYADAVEYAAQAEERFNELSARLEEKLKKAADAAGLSRAEFAKLKEKYDGNIAALAMHIKQGDEGVAMQKSLAKTGKEHAAALEEQAKKQGIVTETMRKAKEAADAYAANLAKVKEELGFTFTSDLKDKINKIESALRDYKKQLSPESEKKLREELAKLRDEFRFGTRPLEDLSARFKDINKDIEDAAKTAKDNEPALKSFLSNLKPDEVDDLGRALQEGAFKIAAIGVKLDEAAQKAKAFAERSRETAATVKAGWDDVVQIWGQAVATIIAGSDSLEEKMKGLSVAFVAAFAQMVATAAGAAGPIAAAIGAIAGAMASGYLPFIADMQEEMEDLQKKVADSILANIAPLGEFSDATKAAYQKLVEEIGVAAATTQMLNQLMAESGVNADNIAQYWWDAAMVLEQFAAGEISASDAAGTLDDAFTTLLNAARSLGQEGSTDMVNFIVTAREMGLEIASVTQYVQQQLNTIPAALQSMVDGLGTSGQNIADMGTLAVATFQSMVDSGMSWGEALDAMGPTLAELKAKYEELGLAADPALQELMNIASVREENEALFDSIDANLQVMQALANTGYLTGEALGAIERNAKQYYDDLIAAGVSADDATRALVPTLQAIYDNHVKSGEPIDANTQALIDQAKALGLIEEATPDPGEVMASGMDRLAEILERIAFALGAGIPDAAEKGAARMESSMSGAADRINEKMALTARAIGDTMGEAADKAVGDWGVAVGEIDSRLAQVSGGTGSNFTADIPGYAGGGVAWEPQMATLAENEPEVIIPMSDYVSGKGLAANAGTGMGGGGTVVNLSIYAQTLDDNTIARASEKIYAAVEREQRRHGRG